MEEAKQISDKDMKNLQVQLLVNDLVNLVGEWRCRKDKGSRISCLLITKMDSTSYLEF